MISGNGDNYFFGNFLGISNDSEVFYQEIEDTTKEYRAQGIRVRVGKKCFFINTSFGLFQGVNFLMKWSCCLSCLISRFWIAGAAFYLKRGKQ